MERFTDVGNRERYMTAFQRLLRYVPDVGWFVWREKLYERNDELPLFWAAACAESIAAETREAADPKLAAAIDKWAKASQNLSRIRAMVELARHHPSVALSHERMDADPWALNCQNGVLDLKTGSMRVHSPEVVQTKITSTPFVPGAQAPLWRQFMREITCENDELARLIQTAVGYTLSGDTSERCFFILEGRGRNGKSVFVETIRTVLGTYGCPVGMSVFTGEERNEVNRELARLRAVRMVTTSEGAKRMRFNESVLKNLTGDERLTARHMYRETIDYQPSFKLWFSTNHVPTLQWIDDAIRDRIRIFPFHFVVDPQKRDPHLRQKLLEEAEGILQWAFEGCLLWQAEGLPFSKAAVSATNEYFEDQDVVGKFLLDATDMEFDGRIATRDLYAVYVKWAEAGNFRPYSINSFSQSLRERGIRSKVVNGIKFWLDMRLTGDAERVRTYPQAKWGAG